MSSMCGRHSRRGFCAQLCSRSCEKVWGNRYPCEQRQCHQSDRHTRDSDETVSLITSCGSSGMSSNIVVVVIVVVIVLVVVLVVVHSSSSSSSSST